MASGDVFMRLNPPGRILPSFGVSELRNVWVETKDMDFDHPEVEKEIIGVTVVGEPSDALAALSLEIGYRNRIRDADPIIWLPAIALNSSEEMLWVRTPAARYFRVRLTDTQAYGRWKVSEIEFYGRLAGGRL